MEAFFRILAFISWDKSTFGFDHIYGRNPSWKTSFFCADDNDQEKFSDRGMFRKFLGWDPFLSECADFYFVFCHNVLFVFIKITIMYTSQKFMSY